jgi:DNA polymerase III sliding clamp (beta) subunit (PCNA family)
MKLKKECKIELIASKDATRHILCNPYLEGSKLIATDGRRLVMIPVEREEGDSDGPVDCCALKLSRKTVSGEKLSKISANGCLKVQTKDGEITMPRKNLDGYSFPQWQKVLPDPKRGGVKIALNAQYLYEMAQAFGGDSVTIEVLDATSPILVKGTGENYIEGSIGVLMPVRIK